MFPAKLKESVLKKNKILHPLVTSFLKKFRQPSEATDIFFPYTPIQDVKPHHTKSGLYECVFVVEGEEIKA